MKTKTKSFVCELPLDPTREDERRLFVCFEVARQIYNACLGEGLRRLRLMRESRDWQRARALPKGHERSTLFRSCTIRFGFREYDLHAYAKQFNRGWLGQHIDINTIQKLATRAYCSLKEHMFGKRGRPRFKGYRGLQSVEGKTNASGIRWRDGVVHWKGLSLQALLDPQDKAGWQAEALSRRTKYCRIVRRQVRGKTRWYVQLVQVGLPPPKQHERTKAVVGLDVGPSTIAVVGEQRAVLERFCPSVEQPWRQTRRIQRAMDRSRRSTNPDNYNPDGTVKPGRKRWNRSERYKRLAAQRAENERRLAAERKRAHGELSNRILALGTTVRTEKLSYRSFQKNFGRSVKVRGPGMLIDMLRRKAESAGGQLEEFPTQPTKLSQVCHGCGQTKKKPLSLRTHECECGVGPVQRDLYSAFLACFVSQAKLNARQAQEAYPAAEPLLRRAALSFNQSASRRASAASRVNTDVRADRPSKGVRKASRPQTSYRRGSHVREGCGEMRSVSSRTPGL